jgi:phage shock protein E
MIGTRLVQALLVLGLLAFALGACAAPTSPAASSGPAPAAPAPAVAATVAPAGSEPAAAPAANVAGRKVTVEGGSYTNVDPAGLETLLKNKNFPLINVHIPYEGELASTDAFIPFDQIDANLGKLPADKNARVVLYCRSGHMSDIAARDLVKKGYTDVWNLDGGMIAWEAAGKAVLHKQ